VSEAAKAVEALKEYRREDGQELTIKFFADDDSEGKYYRHWHCITYTVRLVLGLLMIKKLIVDLTAFFE